jgi:hypothetical protein
MVRTPLSIASSRAGARNEAEAIRANRVSPSLTLAGGPYGLSTRELALVMIHAKGLAKAM